MTSHVPNKFVKINTDLAYFSLQDHLEVIVVTSDGPNNFFFKSVEILPTIAYLNTLR